MSVQAEELGFDPRRLELLPAKIEQDIAAKSYDGAVFIVARHGKIVLHQALGHSDLSSGRRAKLDDVFHLMSLSKQLTTVLVLAAIERGDFSLCTKVCEVIPEFGCKGKHNVTVEHLLTHRSGLNTELPLSLPPGGHMNIQQLVAEVSKERLHRKPGKVVSYNALSAHAILAEMLVRLDSRARPFREIINDDLFQPLKMKDTSLCLRPHLIERRVPVVPRMGEGGIFEPSMYEAMNMLLTEESEFAAGGAIGTAIDLFRFTEMLRLGGALDGVRILSPAMLANALLNKTGKLTNDIFDYIREVNGWPEWPAYIGLTFFLRGDEIFPTPMGTNTSPSTYSAQGAGSTLFWVDPERDLSFICLTAGIIEEADNILRFQKLSDLVVGALIS